MVGASLGVLRPKREVATDGPARSLGMVVEGAWRLGRGGSSRFGGAGGSTLRPEGGRTGGRRVARDGSVQRAAEGEDTEKERGSRDEGLAIRVGYFISSTQLGRGDATSTSLRLFGCGLRPLSVESRGDGQFLELVFGSWFYADQSIPTLATLAAR
jgi:hypothetical protein